MDRVRKEKGDRSPFVAGYSSYFQPLLAAPKLRAFLHLLVLTSLLIACGQKAAPTTSPSGTLQLTIEGLPTEANANVEITGPEAYTQNVTKTQTLADLRTGSYTLTADVVVFQEISYAVQIDDAKVSETTVEITEGKTLSITVSYTSAGEVAPDELAPGIPRKGEVTEGAFDDYSFEGSANVPLTFDLTGTSNETTGIYTIGIYSARDVNTPLFTSPRFSSGVSFPRPLIGFSPPETGNYVFRIRGEEKQVEYQVTARYLNGSAEERSTPVKLTLSEGTNRAEGAVTAGSYDRYAFTSTSPQTIVFKFSYDLTDKRYQGSYQLELYRADESEPLETTRGYATNGLLPEVELTLPEAGDYLIHVVGTTPSAGSSGTSLVRYMFVLEGSQ